MGDKALTYKEVKMIVMQRLIKVVRGTQHLVGRFRRWGGGGRVLAGLRMVRCAATCSTPPASWMWSRSRRPRQGPRTFVVFR